MPKSKVLVVTKLSFFDIDKLGASIVLTKALSSLYKNIDLLIPNKEAILHSSKIFSTSKLSLVKGIRSNTAVISLTTGDVDIKNVDWEKIDGKLEIRLQADKVIPITSYSLDFTENYTHIFSVGIKSLEELSSISSLSPKELKDIEIANIDLRSSNKKYGKVNFVQSDATCYAEIVYRFLKEKGSEIDIECVSELLSCIYWKTNSLRNAYTSASSLKIGAELVELGADTEASSRKIYKTLTSTEQRARGYIYSNVERYRDVGIVILPSDLSKQMLAVLPVFPEKNPLYKVENLSASFILIPVEDKETLVLGSSMNGDLQIKKLFGKYNYVGDSWQFELTLNLSANETKEKILQLLGLKTESNREVDMLSKQVTVVSEEINTETEHEFVEPEVLEEPDEASETDGGEMNEKKENIQDDEQNTEQEKIEEDLDDPKEVVDGIQDESIDPLAPATEEITPEPAPEEPASPAGLGAMGGMGGFGATAVDPLTPASDSK